MLIVTAPSIKEVNEMTPSAYLPKRLELAYVRLELAHVGAGLLMWIGMIGGLLAGVLIDELTQSGLAGLMAGVLIFIICFATHIFCCEYVDRHDVEFSIDKYEK